MFTLYSSIVYESYLLGWDHKGPSHSALIGTNISLLEYCVKEGS
jgi:hypothetical protein